MLIGLKHKNKKINLKVKKCNFFHRFLGLMFTRREKARALLFDFGKSVRISIHSFFVFFPFVAVWLDDKDKIIEIKKINSWRFSVKPEKSFVKLVEIPCNAEYKDILKSLLETSHEH